MMCSSLSHHTVKLCFFGNLPQCFPSLISDDFFMVPPGSAARITISLVACFTCGLAVVFVVWILRRSKTSKLQSYYFYLLSLFFYKRWIDGINSTTSNNRCTVEKATVPVFISSQKPR